MKISNPELMIDCEMPELSVQRPLENEELFKELMEKPAPKTTEEKKHLFPFLAIVEQKPEEIASVLPEEIDLIPYEEVLLQEKEEDSPHKEKEKPQINQQDPLLFTTPYFSLQTHGNTVISPIAAPIQQDPHNVVALMEKVGSEMIVMTSEGSTKTTLVLDSEAFDSSLLKEAKITIEEFSSAPKIFNVKISAGPQAIELVRVHVEEFLKLFQERKFGFSINRIDTELTSSRPLFARKEKTDGEGSGDQQGRHK